MRAWKPIALGALFGAWSGSAAAANYSICIKWEAQTVDSCNQASCGIPNGANTGGREDKYRRCDNGCNVSAKGVRVRLSRAGWALTVDTSPATGCFSFSDSGTSYVMTVYGYATNVNGTYTRIHTDPASFSSYPGNTWRMDFWNVQPTAGATNTYYVGNGTPQWTTMAVVGYGIFRWRNDLHSKRIHVGIDLDSCGGSSAHFGDCSGASCNSNAAITSGRHYLRIGASSCSSPQARRKFVVGHELGHVIAALWYGAKEGASNGGEPGNNASHNVNPNACGIGGTFYSMQSKEWSNLGFREGFGHFVAARIWNNKHTEGAFGWFEGSRHDLERYAFGAGSNSGGRLENQCCTQNCGSSWTNAGTIEDWMRFLLGLLHQRSQHLFQPAEWP